MDAGASAESSGDICFSPLPDDVFREEYGRSLAHRATQAESPELDIEAKELARIALAALSERERELISARFGLDGKGEASLGDVASQLSISRERTRLLECRALQKMQKALRRAPAWSGLRSQKTAKVATQQASFPPSNAARMKTVAEKIDDRLRAESATDLLDLRDLLHFGPECDPVVVHHEQDVWFKFIDYSSTKIPPGYYVMQRQVVASCLLPSHVSVFDWRQDLVARKSAHLRRLRDWARARFDRTSVFWEARLAQPLGIPEFAELLAVTAAAADEPSQGIPHWRQAAPEHMKAAVVAAVFDAFKGGENWFVGDTSPLREASRWQDVRITSDLKVQGRPAAEWLFRMPKRRHLVGPSLAQFLASDPRPTAPSAGK